MVYVVRLVIGGLVGVRVVVFEVRLAIVDGCVQRQSGGAERGPHLSLYTGYIGYTG